MLRKFWEGTIIFAILKLDSEILAALLLLVLVALVLVDFIELYLKEREAQREYPY